jgi:hypothetical protein
MRERPTDLAGDPRPRVTGSFVEPDETARPLLMAIGRALFAAAGLEKTLQLEIARLPCVRHAADDTNRSPTLGRCAVERELLDTFHHNVHMLAAAGCLRKLRILEGAVHKLVPAFDCVTDSPIEIRWQVKVSEFPEPLSGSPARSSSK